QDESGLAPLHLAVYGGYRDMCELLVRHGADLNRKTREEGITPLYMIINKKGDFRAMARWLVEQGADLEARTNRGYTLLFEAIHERDPELVSLFLQQGACTDVTDEKGWLPLHVVANDGDWPLAAHLLDHGAEINAKCQKQGCTPLIMAAGQENVEMVWGLVSRGADLYATSTTGETPLHRAASCGMAGVVDFLVHCGAHVEAVDMKGRTPLHLAAMAGHETTIQVLLAYVLKRENGWTGSEHEEEMAITGWTLFHALALEGNAEILSALSEKSCSVTDRDSLGRTALYLAAEHNHLGVIEAFVKNHGSFLMEMADEEGWRPIHRACQLGHLEVVKRLIELGADPAATHRVREEDIDGVTALHDAAKNNHVAMVKELVNHCPCLLMTVDDRGWTPLHYAVRFDSTEVSKTLIELGADPRAVDQIGNSPVDYLDDRKKKNGLDILFPNTDSATCFETSDDLFVYFQPRVLDLIARLSTLLEDLTGTPYLLHLREIRVFQEKEGPESLFDQDRCLIHVKGSRGQDLGEIYVVVNLTPAIVLSGRIMMTNESVIRRHVENRMVGEELEESFQELGHQIVGALNDWIGKQSATGGMLTLEAIGCVDQHPPILINGSSHLLVTVAIEMLDYPPEYFRLLFSKGWTASLFPGNMWHWFR
ncbi:MAG: ankyrin repeat domain-containing protein, partial [Magnetococcales bacterium]|nr:ankyrin repeat domain-containing protein [Magnetococcales bacterium]